jgi:7-cyano-7-deazaguanine synthase
MRATVYPNRNLIMLSLAAGMAIVRGAEGVAYAAHGGDHPIYPDCRPEFVDAARQAFRVGNWEPIDLIAPFITWKKEDIVRRGADLGVPFAETWSCYKGVRGGHCGTCGTCVERREAFSLAGVPDPTVYR